MRFNLGVALTANSGAPYSITTGRDDNRDGLANDRPAGVPRNSVATMWAPWLLRPMWRLRSSSILLSANELSRMSSGSADHSSDAPNTVIQFTKSRALSSRPISPTHDAS